MIARGNGVDRRRSLERAIDRDRAELMHALQDVKSIAKRRLSLGHRVVAHPAPWLLSAFAVGFWLGWRR